MSIAFSKWFKKGAKLAATLMLGAALTLSSMPSAFALNQDGIQGVQSGHKPLSFTGYKYIDSTHVAVFIDKTITAPASPPGSIDGECDKSMFTVKQHTNNLPIAVTDAAYTATDNDHLGYSGCSDHGLDKGATITLTLATPLAYDTLYDLKMENTLFANQSLNNFNNNQSDPNNYDTTFTFRTPTSSGAYSNTTPYVTYIVGGVPTSSLSGGATNVSYESSLTVVFDRPLASSALSTFLTNLSDNYKRGGVKVLQAVGNEVGRDINNVVSPSLSEYVTYECHYPTSNNINNVNNTFYFPMTNYIGWWWDNGDTTLKQYSFNRKYDGSYSYTLDLPSFTDVSGNTFTSFINARTSPGTTQNSTTGFAFSTVTADLPGHCNQLTVTPTSTPGQLLVTWNPSKIDPAPTGVRIYATSGNKWTSNYQLKGYTSSPTVGSFTITGLTSGTLYWVRIAAYNSIGVTGFSQEFSGTPL